MDLSACLIDWTKGANSSTKILWLFKSNRSTWPLSCLSYLTKILCQPFFEKVQWSFLLATMLINQPKMSLSFSFYFHTTCIVVLCNFISFSFSLFFPQLIPLHLIFFSWSTLNPIFYCNFFFFFFFFFFLSKKLQFQNQKKRERERDKMVLTMVGCSNFPGSLKLESLWGLGA